MWQGKDNTKDSEEMFKNCLLEQSGRGMAFLGSHSPLCPQTSISSKFLPGETSYPSLQSIWQNFPPYHLSQAKAPLPGGVIFFAHFCITKMH